MFCLIFLILPDWPVSIFSDLVKFIRNSSDQFRSINDIRFNNMSSSRHHQGLGTISGDCVWDWDYDRCNPPALVSRCEIFVGITESTQGIIGYNSSALGSNLQVKIALCLLLYLDRSLDPTTHLYTWWCDVMWCELNNPGNTCLLPRPWPSSPVFTYQ